MNWRHPALHGLPAFCAGLVVVSWPAAAAAATLGAPPTALGVQAQLTIDGTATQFGPVAFVEGNPSGAYDNKTDVEHEADIIALAPIAPTPTLFVNAHDLLARVQSTGIQIDSESTVSTASVGSISVSLGVMPLGDTFTPAPILTITGSGIDSDVNFTRVFPGPAVVTAGAGVNSLAINGTLLGNLNLKYSGKAKPNTVIYDTPTMTITLNKEMRVGIISCDPTCTFTVTAITTVAVDVSLYKAPWQGHKITGDIAVGETQMEMQ
jgi:hypothetical protein